MGVLGPVAQAHCVSQGNNIFRLACQTSTPFHNSKAISVAGGATVSTLKDVRRSDNLCRSLKAARCDVLQASRLWSFKPRASRVASE